MLSSQWLWSFRRAWSRRHVERLTIACIGSSTTHGTGATTLERAWVNHLARRLGSASRTYLAHHPGWTYTGTPATLDAEGGLSTLSRQLAPGMTMSRQLGRCNAVKVLHRQRGGQFLVQVDGNTVAVVNPPATVGDRFDGVLTVTGLPLVDHTLTIVANGPAPTVISGAVAVDTIHESGVDVLNAGLGGTHSAVYAMPALGMRGHNRALAAHDPALLVFMVGSNDYALGVDPEIYRQRMHAAVLAARSSCPRDMPVLLVHGHRRFDVANPLHPWPEYGAALAAVADAVPDAAFLDLGAHFPVSQAADTTDLISADAVHLTDAGHAWVGDLIADELLTPVGPARLSDYPAPLDDPATLPGLVAAWDNADLAGDNGDEVEWSPRAATEPAPLTAPVGARATLRLRGLAERPTVVTSVGRCLQTAPWSVPVTGPLTILAVVKPGTPPPTASGILFSGRSGRYTALNMIGDNLAQFFVGNTAPPGVSTAYFGTGRWKVVALVVDGGTVSLLGHGMAPQVSIVTPGASYGLGGLTIGGNSGMAMNIDAEFAELLVFDRALSGAEVETALDALARKHALDGAGRTTA